MTSDAQAIRVDQARMLKQRVIGSCIFVQAIVIYIAAMLWFGGSKIDTLIWIFPTTFMVLATYAYARLKSPAGINRENVGSYLKGHVIICSITGMLWGGFAIYHLDWAAQYSLFVSCTIVATITIGGMLPGATYRPGFIGLSTFMIVPFGLYVLATGHGPLRVVGFGLLILYAFGLMTSARAQQNTHIGISAKRERELSAKIAAQSKIIQRANDEKTRFLAATSHDLSQPLHAQGFFIQALRNILSTQAQNELLDKVEASWRSQESLLQGLVDITRLDSGVIIPKLTYVDIKAELTIMAGEFSELTKAKSIQFTNHFETATIYTDTALLARILRNILSNAVKFTPKNGHINFTSRLNGDRVEITIKDSGSGVALADQRRIFDEYVQLENTHLVQKKGLGLGLSIVQRLVALLNIDMEFQSTLDQGTKYVFTIPLHNQQAISPSNPRPLETNFHTSPLIILVDDEQTIRESMSTLMTSWGCQIICAASGKEAIDLLSKTAEIPVLLIVDKRLANGENGNDVIDKLREEVNETTPAILITGDLKGFGDAQPSADVQLMLKPVNPDQIKQVIADIIML